MNEDLDVGAGRGDDESRRIVGVGLLVCGGAAIIGGGLVTAGDGFGLHPAIAFVSAAVFIAIGLQMIRRRR